MPLPQLFMRNPDISGASPVILPDGIKLCHHVEGEEKRWEELIEKAFGAKYSFDAMIRNGGDYAPEHVLYLYRGEKAVATVTAVEKADFPGEGWFRMVGVDPECRGKGFGKLICLAAIYELKKRGYNSVVLSTDDKRLPAIKLYYSLGFRPVISHESHEERWQKIMPLIGQ